MAYRRIRALGMLLQQGCKNTQLADEGQDHPSPWGKASIFVYCLIGRVSQIQQSRTPSC